MGEASVRWIILVMVIIFLILPVFGRRGRLGDKPKAAKKI